MKNTQANQDDDVNGKRIGGLGIALPRSHGT